MLFKKKKTVAFFVDTVKQKFFFYSKNNVDKEPCKPKKVSRGKKAVSHSPNPLDRTCVHPESYDLAEMYYKKFLYRKRPSH